MHKKRFIVSVIVMTMMLLPVAMSAQGMFGSDNFFKVEENNYNNRSNITYNSDGINIAPMNIDDPTVPLGSGLLIMVISGAGYVFLKNKEEKL